MYKFTNGLILYTEEDAKKAQEAGYKLIEKQIVIDEVINEDGSIRSEKFIDKSNSTIKKSNNKIKRSI